MNAITDLLERITAHYEDSRHDHNVPERAKLMGDARRLLNAMKQADLVDRLLVVRNAFDAYMESFTTATVAKQDVAIIPRETHNRILAALEVLNQ
jgi:hypothetical protein